MAPLVSVTLGKLSATLPASMTSTRNVGASSSPASAAGASGTTLMEMGAFGSTVVNSTAGPSVRSAAGSASAPDFSAGVVCGIRTMYARLPPLLK